jgi:hypothetical protein
VRDAGRDLDEEDELVKGLLDSGDESERLIDDW